MSNARYAIEFSHRAAKQFRKLDDSIAMRIAACIERLSDDPRPVNSKKLVGSESFRVRVGEYRVIYEIKDKQLIVLILKIGHRRDIYQ